MTRAPSVTSLQAKMLRLIRDSGGSMKCEYMGWLEQALVKWLLYHRWVAPRGDRGNEHVVMTDAGKAALAYFDASCKQEELWRGLRGWEQKHDRRS